MVNKFLGFLAIIIIVISVVLGKESINCTFNTAYFFLIYGPLCYILAIIYARVRYIKDINEGNETDSFLNLSILSIPRALVLCLFLICLNYLSSYYFKSNYEQFEIVNIENEYTKRRYNLKLTKEQTIITLKIKDKSEKFYVDNFEFQQLININYVNVEFRYGILGFKVAHHFKNIDE
jgi:hypothetical protein